MLVQFSQMVNLHYIMGLIFVDVHTHAQYVELHNQVYFVGLIFVVR